MRLTVNSGNRFIAGARVLKVISHGVYMPRTSAIYDEADASHVVGQAASMSPRVSFRVRSEERVR
eukprot:1533420-Pleurochrysis_carterae.AAC.1